MTIEKQVISLDEKLQYKTRKCTVYPFCDFYKQKNETVKITHFSPKKNILILKIKYSVLLMVYNYKLLI